MGNCFGQCLAQVEEVVKDAREVAKRVTPVVRYVESGLDFIEETLNKLKRFKKIY